LRLGLELRPGEKQLPIALRLYLTKDDKEANIVGFKMCKAVEDSPILCSNDWHEDDLAFHIGWDGGPAPVGWL